MKWPNSITIIRHAQSAYNALRVQKAADPDYAAFKEAYDEDFTSPRARALAEIIQKRYSLAVGDYKTPLSGLGYKQARETGRKLKDIAPAPDVILVSPYLRTQETLKSIREGGFDIGDARVVPEDRIREQEHGLAAIYNDWRVFHVKHPEQKSLRELYGPYWYQFPQGESVSDVRERIRSMTNTFIREYAGMNVMLVTHHLTILSIRANFERLSPEAFIHLDENAKPTNCGVTIYHGDSKLGKDGKLVLKSYNKSLLHRG